MKLLDHASLERSGIVANRRMNRERGLVGGNGYQKDLGFNPVDFLLAQLTSKPAVAWLDLCCGSGRALVEAAQQMRELGLDERVAIVGVDLVPMFVPVPPEFAFVRFEEGSVTRWEPNRSFDLVTCVHGLHYLGDKLGVLARASRRLAPEGRLVANLDAASIKVEGHSKAQLVAELRRAGFVYNPRRRLISRLGTGRVNFPFTWLGADDTAGPNYTGQSAVDSHYRGRP